MCDRERSLPQQKISTIVYFQPSLFEYKDVLDQIKLAAPSQVVQTCSTKSKIFLS